MAAVGVAWAILAGQFERTTTCTFIILNPAAGLQCRLSRESYEEAADWLDLIKRKLERAIAPIDQQHQSDET